MIRRRAAFADLGEAVEWLRQWWSARDIPSRLHEREFGEDGAPRYTPAFSRYLSAKHTDQDHDHGQTDRADTCPYRYPMWRALEILAADDRAHPARQSWRDVILSIVINAFDTRDVAALGIRPSTQFLAIRELHARYVLAPERTSWIAKSESQRTAEQAVA